MKTKEYMLKEFYNYKEWRDIQIKQLSIISNIFFTFNVVVIGYIIDYIIKHDIENNVIKNLLLFVIMFFTLSIMFYILFHMVRLSDYRTTAKLIRRRISYEKISVKTCCLGKGTWILFYAQIGLSAIALIVTLFTFYQILF